MPAEPTEAPPTSCLNCHHAFDGPGGAALARFCPQCGQDRRERAPRVGEFVRQFTGAYLSSDGALWRTLGALLRPGLLTAEYLAGRRRHYVLPVRLYLTVGLVLLLALRMSVAPGIGETGVDLPARPREIQVLALGDSRAGVQDGVFFCERLPRWVCRRLERRLDVDAKGLARELEDAVPRFISHAGTAMAVLVPLFAVWTFLAHLGGGWRYAEHLVFALHVHVAWFALLLLALPGLPWLSGIAVLAMPVYHLLAARRVYRLGRWATLWRAALVAVAYALTLGLAVAAVMITTLLG